MNTIRWGDAPVHSIAASLFLSKNEIHFFDDIGYRHDSFMHCPMARELQKKCHCDAQESFGKYIIQRIMPVVLIILLIYRSHIKFMLSAMGQD